MIVLLVLLLFVVSKPIDSLNCTAPIFANFTVQSNFDLNKFLGVWYEIKWFSTEFHNASDIWLDYYQNFELDNAFTQHLLVSGQARSPNETTCFSFGPWSIIANNSAKMILEKKNLNSNTSLNWPYYIITTDYDHYALVYACQDKNFTVHNPCLEPLVWVFSRAKILSTEYSTELDRRIENELCLNSTRLDTSVQSENICYRSSSTIFKYSQIPILSISFLAYFQF